MGKRKERDALVFLNEHMKMAAEMLTERERGRLYEALRVYALEGKTPNLEKERKAYRSIYSMMEVSQDKYRDKYEETCERNRLRALRRVEPSAAGGCQSNPIQSNPIKSNTIQSNQSKTETLPALKGQAVKGVPGIEWL